MDETLITELIQNDQFKMKVLHTVRELGLPDWLIGAGFVRNLVWDHLHGFEQLSPSTDIDIAYFDPLDLSEDTEKRFEILLQKKLQADWSITNQARMGKLNNQKREYTSTKDALAHWPETATAIGVTMHDNDELKIIAPHGLDDLFSLTLRMTPEFGDGYEAFLKRIEKKGWLTKWPKLKMATLPDKL